MSFDAGSIRVCLVRMNRQISRSLALILALAAIVALTGCSKSEQSVASVATPQPGGNAKQPGPVSPASASSVTGFDACASLTKDEIQAVQGEPFKDTKRSQKTGSGLSVSQCYFELPQVVNSIVVTVTQRAEGLDARDPAKDWQQIFHRTEPAEKEEGEEKEPQKVDGIGDEAFWTGNRVGGALYVLKGNSYIRISVGGAGEQADKIKKSKALAQSILGRL
jgi:hypothetical protein